MKIRFLGGCREVGRSSLVLKTGEKHILLDYGVIMDHEIGFPMHISPREVEAIVLTHAHLDHSGLTPLFYLQGRIPLFGAEPTFALSNLLIKDFLHLSSYYLPYEYIDLQTMMSHRVGKKYSEKFDVNGCEVELKNAGHIPGSSQVIVESEGKRVLYTGDFNTIATRLLHPADRSYENLDAFVVEATYADENHSPRSEIEEQFVSQATEIVANGGSVLVPAFGVGRSQEVLSVLAAHNFQYPVFIDGMAIDTINILLNHLDSLRDGDEFRKAVKRVEWMERWQDRKRAINIPSVIVSPAGMLKGGAAIFYMESMAKSRKNAIFLVSFQIPGTPGWVLMEKKRFMLHGKARKVEASVQKFDFSSHCGRGELEDTLSKLDKKSRVFVMHGAEGNCRRLAAWATREMGLEAVAPKPGESYDI